MIALDSTTPATARGPGPAPGRRWQTALVPFAALPALETEWRLLGEEAVEDSPFMSPDFLLPALTHAGPAAPQLLAVREPEGGRLVGLFVLTGAATLSEIWLRPRPVALWRHATQAFALPLLAGSEKEARRTVAAALAWLSERPALAGLEAGALPAASLAARLLEEEARARGLPVQRRPQPDNTRGLNFQPRHLQGAVDRVEIVVERVALRRAVEQLLCLDREENARAILLEDPLLPAFLRGVTRGYARCGRAAVALACEADARAGALVLVGRERAYLWRLFGPDADDPAIEAALAVAASKTLGLPLVAASTRRLAGAGTEPMPTESLSIGLRAEPGSVISRIWSWVG
jgi:hypothetical protein